MARSSPKRRSFRAAWHTAARRRRRFERIKEAIRLWVETAHERGDLAPEPKGECLMLA